MKHLGRGLPRKLVRRLRAADTASAGGPAAGRQAGESGTPSGDTLVRAIQRGTPLPDALVLRTRGLLRSREVNGAQSFAESLRAQPETEQIGRLLCGIVAYHRGFLPLAWQRLEGIPRTTWARHAPREYTRCGLRICPDQTLREIEKLSEEQPSELPADTWFAIIGPVLAVGRTDVARRVLAVLDRLAPDAPDAEALQRRIEGLRAWVSVDPGSEVGSRTDGVGFAVLDYKRPGTLEGSQNIGDHIQSIAALGHLVRHTKVRLHGEPELVDLLTQMQERTRPELRLEELDSRVEVLTVQRDASEYEVVPDGTWTLCFGWYMHPIFGFRHGFPLNRALRPVFVSFHCNERELLTEAAVEYLKKYGPVGCRDWTTVHLLLSRGVPAFFSGCLTTTISTVFPDSSGQAAPEGAVAYVDARGNVPPDADRFRHADPAVRSRSFAANCLVALERLETYRRRYARVVTSRLHCYLPLRSLGVPVDFRPDNRSDIRFNGLIDITDDEFDAMRGNLLDKLQQVFTAILAGQDEDSVYALWRDITSPDVEAARAHAEAGPDPTEDPTVLHRNLAELATRTRTQPSTAHAGEEEVVHCAVELQKGDAKRLKALSASLRSHTSVAVHLHVLADGARPRLEEDLVREFPQHTFSWLDIGGIGRDLRDVTGKPPRQLARLCLPDLLPDVHRLVLLPVGSVVTGDLAELARLDLEGHWFAAPTTADVRHDSGFGVLHRAAARLGDQTHLAATLLRNAYAKHTFDFDAFSTDVMVLDLQRMRSEGFVDRAVALSTGFGLDAREVLHYVAGPGRAEVPASWAHVPTQQPDTAAGLVHWVGETKPWDVTYVPGQELWRLYADAR